MIDITEFLTRLRQVGIEVYPKLDNLIINAPKGVLTTELHQAINEHKAKLITFLSHLEAVSLALPPLRSSAQSNLLPLSFAQNRQWVLSQLAPNSPVYNIFTPVRFRGPLKVEAIEQGINEIVRRHHSLRTRFEVQSNLPLPKVVPFTPQPLPVIDLFSLPPTEREQRARELATIESKRPFNLADEPLCRFSLLRLTETDHLLITTMHRLIVDEWSVDLFWAELAVLYPAFVQGRPSPLPELPLQYADYARWQQECWQNQALAEQLEYWQQQLGGDLPILELHTDRPRTVIQTFNGAVEFCPLPAFLVEGMQTISLAAKVAPYISLLAAFKVLLYRYTGQEDLLLGFCTANRTQPATEAMIGALANTLVLRTDLSGQPSFTELLARVKTGVTSAYRHQDLPFEKLLEHLQPERDPSRSPLFQVMFDFRAIAPMELGGGLEMSRYPAVDNGLSLFDLSLLIEETPQGWKAIINYNTDLFDRETIQRMLGHYQTLLAGITANPEQSITELPLLTEAEHRQLLVEWNDTTAPYPQELCIHHLFEAQAARTPEAVAVVAPERGAGQLAALTYGELNHRANQLAHHLIRLGVGPDTLVGLYTGRSVEMLVGILGILKAGGAYVPLDPAYPTDRLAFMLADAGVVALLTQQKLLNELPEYQTIPTFCLDADWPAIAVEPTANPTVGVTPTNLAYIIYTSGSTGQPKGVMIEHRSLVNYTCSAAQQFGLTPADRVLQFASISFDAAAEEIYPCLTRGGQLVLRTDLMLGYISTFLQKCQEWGITILDLPTAYWHEVVARLNSEALVLPPSIRLVIIGGEKALPERVTVWQAKVGGSVRLLNTYGPTETTVVATAWELLPQAGPTWQEVPIGRPVANTQIYILDKYLQPVPIGLPGEVYIGGHGLARGYLHQSTLTNEKFIEHPFSQISGARLYKSGDVARYLPDGNIEFLGRIDHQVKIRGFRIELGEIESVLEQHPHIRENVVVVREDSPGEKRLVAYLVQPSPVPLDELRQYLKEKLPEYMVPTVFVNLEVMPLTPNGKINRRALPTPELTTSTNYILPRTITEQTLMTIWTAVLKMDQIGINDHFLGLGGHSLLAAQIIARVWQQFQQEIPIEALFQYPTIASLAAYLDNNTLASPSTLVPLLPRIDNSNLPLSPAQKRLWFLQNLEPDNHFYHTVDAIYLTGPLDIIALERSFNEIIHRHEVLRTSFTEVAGVPVQVICPRSDFALEYVSLIGLSKEQQNIETKRYILYEAKQPFDLTTGPLVRVLVLGLTAEEYILVLCIHHIVTDEWSTHVLYQELNRLYPCFHTATACKLTELPLQYADFALWQQAWLESDAYTHHLAYWQQKLAGMPPLLELPTDHPRPTTQSYRGGLQTFTLSSDLSRALMKFSQQENVTLFMTLLAAFKVLLYRYSQQEDLVVGTPSANRDQVALEPLIGFFVNTLVLRTSISANLTFRDFLQTVRQTVLEAQRYRDVPFEKLVEVLQPERNLSYSPIFQVMFVYQNEPVPLPALPGLSAQPFDPIDTGSTQFDLILNLTTYQDYLQGSFIYSTDLFEPGTIQRMTRHFETLLQEILKQPQKTIAQLPLFSQAERHQLLFEWNNTRADYPADKTVAQLFEMQAAQTPHAPALVFRDQTLTYHELNRRANLLAWQLQELGVGPGMPVAVKMERAFEVIVALLGVLKAGGAYVPIDPAYPTDRQTFMLNDTHASILLTQSHLKQSLPVGPTIICLDTAWGADNPANPPNPLSGVGPDDIANIIYTSGSTGTPKGVMVRQRGIVRLAINNTLAPFDADQAMLQISPISFDGSTFEIWGPLLNGGRCVLLSDNGIPDPHELESLIADNNITILWLTASLFNTIITESPQTVRGIKHLLTGGEALSVPHVLRALELLPDTQLTNGYGPTENTVATSCYHIPRSLDKNIASIPIGRPINNTQIYILNNQLEPLSVGEVGELYTGGDGVAAGYLNRPDLTAERFIQNPFSQNPANRLYKTGDRVRYLPDGNIEFIGRVDDQVKLRGFRIELGEVEAAIVQHPLVAEAVVILRQDTPGDKSLVAYVTSAAGQAVDIALLRADLAGRLPAFMIPTDFVRLDRIPLTPNGKADRHALPAPAKNRHDKADTFIAPRTPTEMVIARTIADLLNLKQVGVYDNFFELGGHSLLAIQIISRLRDSFQIELPLRSLFEGPTVAELARLVDVVSSIRQNIGATPNLTSDLFEQGEL